MNIFIYYVHVCYHSRQTLQMNSTFQGIIVFCLLHCTFLGNTEHNELTVILYDN